MSEPAAPRVRPDGRLNGMFDSKPQPVPWFSRERLLAGRGHLLAGIGGSSKTRMLYHLGAGAVLGELPWDWEVSTIGSAALFLTEDVTAQVHRVIFHLGERLNLEQRKLITHRMRVFPLAGHGVRLLAVAGNALHETEAYDWLMSMIDALPKPVAFIGLDPALGLTEGDELSPAHQRRLGELVDRIAIDTGACTMLTAHAIKGIHQAEELGSHTSRGSGAITDAVRGEFALRNMTADEAKRFGIDDRTERQLYVQLAATKGNELPPEAFAPVWLKRGTYGMLEGVSLEQVKRGSVGKRELDALEVLRTSGPGSTTLKFWRVQCVSAGLIPRNSNEGAQEKCMQRIRDVLKDAGLVIPGAVRGMWSPA